MHFRHPVGEAGLFINSSFEKSFICMQKSFIRTGLFSKKRLIGIGLFPKKT